MLAYRRTALRRRVLVNLDGGRAFNGVLWAQRGPLLVLRNAELLEPGREPVALDGDIVIERDRIDFVQVT